MFCMRQLWCKHETGGRHPTSTGLPDQILRLQCITLQEPQNAAWHCKQQSHPDGEHVRRDFGRTVQAAEDHALCGQAAILAAWCTVGDNAPAIVDLVTIGHVYELFT